MEKSITPSSYIEIVEEGFAQLGKGSLGLYRSTTRPSISPVMLTRFVSSPALSANPLKLTLVAQVVG